MTTLQTVLTIAATATTSGTLTAGRHTPVDATSGAVTMTLPAPANVGARLRVEKVDGSANTVTVSGTIRGAAGTLVLVSQFHTVEFVAESTSSWRPASDHRTAAGIAGDPTLRAAFAPSQEAVNTVAASGAAQTLPDPAVQSISRVTLTANCALTFPTATAGKSLTLVLVQDATGSRTVTWPGGVKWAGGTPPTLSTGAGKIDYLSFVCTDGANWAGFPAGLDMR